VSDTPPLSVSKDGGTKKKKVKKQKKTPACSLAIDHPSAAEAADAPALAETVGAPELSDEIKIGVESPLDADAVPRKVRTQSP
jgi:hypothetical protein